MSLTRKMSKERTRARLVQGALKVLHRDGAAALTTGRIAEAAGVAQPTFYVHFEGIDEALEEAGKLVTGRFERALTSSHLEETSTIPTVIRSYAEALLDDSKSLELFHRHRRDRSSAFGRELRKYADGLREALVGHVAGWLGESASFVSHTGDLCLGMLLGSLEGVLDGRIDLDDAVDTLARSIEAVLPKVRALATEAAE
jgi:TetR/AcrR family transcriptional regulator, fatty acid biosynthesis regulator